MNLIYCKDNGFSLEDKNSFKAFKLVLKGFEEGDIPNVHGLEQESEDHIWVDQAHVSIFSNGAEWLNQFSEMVAKAAKYGWIHPETQAIKAHVEWQQNASDATILVRQEQDYSVITLNRPQKMNAFTVEMLKALQKVIHQESNNENCRAILITGNGKGFCAGQDLNERKGLKEAPDLGASLRENYNPVISTIYQSEKPIICAVNGVAAGAGVGLALACDLVIAAESSKFILSFSRIGLGPDAGISWNLPRLIGQARAKALTILAEPISAEQAVEWGMIWKIEASENLIDEAEKLTSVLAKRPTGSFSAIKKSFSKSATNTLQEQLLLESELQQIAGKSEDYKRGVEAFFSGEPAQFIGR